MAHLSGIPGAARIMTILHQLDADPGALSTVGATWTKAGAAAALTAAEGAVEAIAGCVCAAVAALPATMNDIAGIREREAKVAAIVGPALGQAETALNTAVNALRDATGTITANCSTTPLQSLPPISASTWSRWRR